MAPPVRQTTLRPVSRHPVGDAPIVFRYRGQRSSYDRFVLFFWIFAFGVSLAGLIQFPSAGLALCAVAALPYLLGSLAKAKLEIHQNGFTHGSLRESVKFESIGELQESEYDLSVVHLQKSDWVRLTLPKNGFCPRCWPRMVQLMAKRTAEQSPNAAIEVKSSI